VNGDQIRQREGRNIWGYQSRFSHTNHLKGWSLQSNYGAGFRYDAIDNSELSNTINRNTVLRYAQLGNIKELNAFALVDKNVERDSWLINIGARLDYFHFSYLDKLQSNQQPDQGKFMVSPKLNIQYTFNKRIQLYLKAGKGFHSNDARVVVFNRGKDILPAAYGSDIGVLLKPTPRLLINTAAWYLYLEQEFVYVGDEGVVELELMFLVAINLLIGCLLISISMLRNPAAWSKQREIIISPLLRLSPVPEESAYK
jgi:outer membrane receptor protein involved in Fe transport